MHFFRAMRTSVFLVIALAAPVFAQGSIFPDDATQKAAKRFEPSTISEESRAFLKTKMKRHGKELQELSTAVATLRFTEVQRLAQAIANQPRLDSTSGPAMKLSPRFFELQDELRKNAQALSDAAKANEMSAMHETFSLVTQNCMSCHAAFRAQVQQK